MNKWWLIPLLALMGCSGGESTVQLKPNCKALLLWEPPIDYVDGSPFNVQDIEKYTIYVSRQKNWNQNNLTFEIDITDKYLVSWEVSNLPPGQNWFYITVTTIEGDVSGYSNIKGKICT